FFSSRRRHTRSYGDWSSDVCSSDLNIVTSTQGRLIHCRKEHSCNGSTDLGCWSRCLPAVWPLSCGRSCRNPNRTPSNCSPRARRSEERRVGKEYGARGSRGKCEDKQ